MTNTQFKQAIRRDGNLKMVNNKQSYVLRTIRYLNDYGLLTDKQADSLTNWAYTKFEDR